jgi:hypothetical protein
MRWNHYMSSGNTIPRFCRHSDELPAIASGLMKSVRTAARGSAHGDGRHGDAAHAKTHGPGTWKTKSAGKAAAGSNPAAIGNSRQAAVNAASAWSSTVISAASAPAFTYPYPYPQQPVQQAWQGELAGASPPASSPLLSASTSASQPGNAASMMAMTAPALTPGNALPLPFSIAAAAPQAACVMWEQVDAGIASSGNEAPAPAINQSAAIAPGPVFQLIAYQVFAPASGATGLAIMSPGQDAETAPRAWNGPLHEGIMQVPGSAPAYASAPTRMKDIQSVRRRHVMLKTAAANAAPE